MVYLGLQTQLRFHWLAVKGEIRFALCVSEGRRSSSKYVDNAEYFRINRFLHMFYEE